MSKLAKFYKTEEANIFIDIIENKIISNHIKLVRSPVTEKTTVFLAKEQAYLEMLSVLKGSEASSAKLDKQFAELASRLSIVG